MDVTLSGEPCAGKNLQDLLLGDVALTLSTVRAIRAIATAAGPTEAVWDWLEGAAAIERQLWSQAAWLERGGHHEAA